MWPDGGRQVGRLLALAVGLGAFLAEVPTLDRRNLATA